MVTIGLAVSSLAKVFAEIHGHQYSVLASKTSETRLRRNIASESPLCIVLHTYAEALQLPILRSYNSVRSARTWATISEAHNVEMVAHHAHDKQVARCLRESSMEGDTANMKEHHILILISFSEPYRFRHSNFPVIMVQRNGGKSNLHPWRNIVRSRTSSDGRLDPFILPESSFYYFRWLAENQYNGSLRVAAS